MNNAPNAVASRNDSENAGSHWYGIENGRVVPLYKEGGTFTKREARKLLKEGKAVLPSVTTYFKCLHKQMLVDWLMGQAVTATLEVKRADFAKESEWVDAALAKANNASKGAMDLGTRIHKALEQGLEGGDYEADMDVYVRPVFAKLKEADFVMEAQEICIADTSLGYAGRTDIVGNFNGNPAVLDAKSRKTIPGKKARGYGTDLMQLLAYGRAHYGPAFLQRGICQNLVISTTEPGRVEIITHDPADYHAAWDAFMGLTAVWRFEQNMDPRSK